MVPEPQELRSSHGVLRVDLSFRTAPGPQGAREYCYVSPDGREAPTLRVQPGDLVILRLHNEQPSERAAPATAVHAASSGEAQSAEHLMSHPGGQGCTTDAMEPGTTNVHFHGLAISPVCHQDDVLDTLIAPGSPVFEYRFRIPPAHPPGLYFYHPHVHGTTQEQVLGGASGALIIEGIERENSELAGLPERVLIVRDEALRYPDAQPLQSDSVPPPLVIRDAEGDILNTGTGTGKPARDLSINFVPVPYPEYRPAVIPIRPRARQLWRVLNASAVTYLDLQLLVDGRPQLMRVVGLDGAPLRAHDGRQTLWESHALVPPAGRVELIVKGPPLGSQASFVTRPVDTGPAGENDPTRPLAKVVAQVEAPEPLARLDRSPRPLRARASVWLGQVAPVRTRKLYFSEQPRDPGNPNGPIDYFITVEGQVPRLFDSHSRVPDIVVRQGDVEEWVIENRTRELHAFHIHQTHFLLERWNGVPLDEPFLRDTINVAYWDGKSAGYPSVTLRMDFRDPRIVGTFPYHCHLLEHEDGGMMGLIRVEPRSPLPTNGR